MCKRHYLTAVLILLSLAAGSGLASATESGIKTTSIAHRYDAHPFYGYRGLYDYAAPLAGYAGMTIGEIPILGAPGMATVAVDGIL